MDGQSYTDAPPIGVKTTILGSAATEKIYPVTEEYGNLQKAIATIDQSAKELRERLGIILAPESLSDAKNTGNPQVSLSPFAEKIRSDTSNIYYVNDILRDMISRIEINNFAQ